MTEGNPEATLQSVEQYRDALDRANALRDAGETAETNAELAALDGAIAQYAGEPGKPAVSAGRPASSRD
jgi:hypothetical protein